MLHGIMLDVVIKPTLSPNPFRVNFESVQSAQRLHHYGNLNLSVSTVV